MSLSELKTNILALDLVEAKHPLLLLCSTLQKSNNANDQKIIEIANELVVLLATLSKRSKEKALTTEEFSIELNRLKNSLDQLKEAAQVNHLSKEVKKVLLDVVGFITGTISGLVWGVFMVPIGLLTYRHYSFGTFEDMTRYFFTGFLQGMILSRRFVHSLENSHDRQMRFTTDRLELSFQSLEDTSLEKYTHEEQDKVLAEFLGEGATEAEKQQFLNSQQEYKLIAFQAIFLTSNLKGSVGHHGTIVYAGTHIIELSGSPSTEEVKKPDQEELRTCNGQTLVDMFVMHRLLQNNYSWSRRLRYRAGDYDCQTYLDIILASTNQPLSTLTRATPEDTLIGRTVCHLLNKFSIFPTATEEGIPVLEADDKYELGHSLGH